MNGQCLRISVNRLRPQPASSTRLPWGMRARKMASSLFSMAACSSNRNGSAGVYPWLAWTRP